METIHSYRHIVDSDTAKMFEKALKIVIEKNKPKNIGFIGLIMNYNKKEHHDIDVLIFPAIDSKIGATLIEVIDLYKKVDKELKKINERFYIATASRKAMQELIYYIAGIEEGSATLIPVHSLFYPDSKSFKKFNPESFKEEISKNLIPLHGSYDIIEKVKNDIPDKKLEPYFVILDFEMNARIKSFPKHNIRASAESLFGYLKDKYQVKTPNKMPHDVNEIEQEFIRILKELDKKTYN